MSAVSSREKYIYIHERARAEAVLIFRCERCSSTRPVSFFRMQEANSLSYTHTRVLDVCQLLLYFFHHLYSGAATMTPAVELVYICISNQRVCVMFPSRLSLSPLRL